MHYFHAASGQADVLQFREETGAGAAGFYFRELERQNALPCLAGSIHMPDPAEDVRTFRHDHLSFPAHVGGHNRVERVAHLCELEIQRRCEHQLEMHSGNDLPLVKNCRVSFARIDERDRGGPGVLT